MKPSAEPETVLLATDLIYKPAKEPMNPPFLSVSVFKKPLRLSIEETQACSAEGITSFPSDSWQVALYFSRSLGL